MCKISIAMATYNGEEYLLEQLDSIRLQTVKVDEVIICDDGSKDNTIKILSKYILEYGLQDNWFVYENEKNLGYANNFFQALQRATGDYIFFSDQDDIWCNDKVQKVVEIMEKNQQIKLLCTDYQPFTSASNAPTVPEKVMKKMKMDCSIEMIPLSKRNIYIQSLGCDMCIRKSFRDQIAPFWIKGWAHDDFVWKTAQCVDGCYEYHEALLKRRLHDHNVSMRKMHGKDKRTKFLRELAEANTGMLQFAKSVNLEKSKIHFIKRTIKASMLRADLVEKCRLRNAFILLGYVDCYQSKKSIFMEPYIAIKNHK